MKWSPFMFYNRQFSRRHTINQLFIPYRMYSNINLCCLYIIFIVSKTLLMFSILNLGWNDARVAGLEAFWSSIEVLVRGNELSLIVTASITDHNLRRILVWHHNGGLWQSASESIWMVWLQGLFEHSSMEIISDLKLVLRKGSYFW